MFNYFFKTATFFRPKWTHPQKDVHIFPIFFYNIKTISAVHRCWSVNFSHIIVDVTGWLVDPLHWPQIPISELTKEAEAKTFSKFRSSSKGGRIEPMTPPHPPHHHQCTHHHCTHHLAQMSAACRKNASLNKDQSSYTWEEKHAASWSNLCSYCVILLWTVYLLELRDMFSERCSPRSGRRRRKRDLTACLREIIRTPGLDFRRRNRKMSSHRFLFFFFREIQSKWKWTIKFENSKSISCRFVGFFGRATSRKTTSPVRTSK